MSKVNNGYQQSNGDYEHKIMEGVEFKKISNEFRETKFNCCKCYEDVITIMSKVNINLYKYLGILHNKHKLHHMLIGY